MRITVAAAAVLQTLPEGRPGTALAAPSKSWMQRCGRVAGSTNKTRKQMKRMQVMKETMKKQTNMPRRRLVQKKAMKERSSKL